MGQVQMMLDGLREVRKRRKQKPYNTNPIPIESSPTALASLHKINAALDQEFAIEVKEKSLQEVVDLLRKRLGFPIHVDRTALKELDVELNSQVTYSQRQGSAREALEKMLEYLDPSVRAIPYQEVLLITTKEIADERARVAFYPIDDLIAFPHFGKGMDNGEGLVFYSENELVEAIHMNVTPWQWGPGNNCQAEAFFDESVSGTLIVSQNEIVHQGVKKFLAECRRVVAERAKTKLTGKNSGEKKPADDYATVIYRLWQSSKQVDRVDEQELVQVLKKHVMPESWNAKEVVVSTLPNRLIIRQKQSVHFNIYAALSSLGLLNPPDTDHWSVDIDHDIGVVGQLPPDKRAVPSAESNK